MVPKVLNNSCWPKQDQSAWDKFAKYGHMSILKSVYDNIFTRNMMFT